MDTWNLYNENHEQVTSKNYSENEIRLGLSAAREQGYTGIYAKNAAGDYIDESDGPVTVGRAVPGILDAEEVTG